MDVKHVYLNNCMDRVEYIIIQISMIPQEFINEYDPKRKLHNRYIFLQVTKIMYGLQKAGQISHDALVKHLAHYGYQTSIKIPGLWINNSCPINSTLVVNDFSVKYSGK